MSEKLYIQYHFVKTYLSQILFHPDTWFFVANIGVVSYWRGMWGFWDDYFLPEKSYPWPILSNLFSALIGKKRLRSFNKAVYTTTPVAGSWAGAVMIWAGAVLLWVGAVMIWAGACSNTNFPTRKMPKSAKKVKCDGRTRSVTDGPTR